jgi:hypothetical protein
VPCGSPLAVKARRSCCPVIDASTDIIDADGMQEGARPLTSSDFIAADDVCFLTDEFCVGFVQASPPAVDIPDIFEGNESVSSTGRSSPVSARGRKSKAAQMRRLKRSCVYVLSGVGHTPPPAPLARSGGVSQLLALWPLVD